VEQLAEIWFTFDDALTPRKMVGRAQRLVEKGHRSSMGAALLCPKPRLCQVCERLFPQLTPEGMMGEVFNLLSDAVSVLLLKGLDD